MQKVDLIINASWVIPIQPANTTYENYSVIVKDSRILNILPSYTVNEQYQSDEVINLPHHALLPGFVNAHTHSPMILFRGLADDLLLMEWLNEYIWPSEQKWVDEQFIRDGTQLALVEMLKSGTTCFNEHYFYPDLIAEESKAAGMRACIGLLVINVPTKWSKDEEDSFSKGVSIFEQFQHDPLITFSMAPHAPYTTTDTILTKIRDYSREHKLPIHMHVHETANEVEQSLASFSKRPLKRLYDLGLLSEHFQCVHMTQINDEDIELLKATRANVTHCPESNLKLASGYCPTQKLLVNDINIALGTDSAVSNNNLDMLGEIRTAALIGKAVANDATAVNAGQALHMATLGGATALGLQNQIGSIEVGKFADLIAIDLDHISTQPLYHPMSQIVYAAYPHQVSDVWIAGKHLVKNTQLLALNEQEIKEKVKVWSSKIKSC